MTFKNTNYGIDSGRVIWDQRRCEWCGEQYHPTAASCGTGTTWNLYKCPHCEKFTIVGWAIPDAARKPDTKVIETEPIGHNALAQEKWNEAIDEQCTRAVENAPKYVPSTKELAHIRWRVAKQEVVLLEKEYGFGRKEPKSQICTCPIQGMDPNCHGCDFVIPPKTIVKPRAQVRERGTDAIYHVGKSMVVKEIRGNFGVMGSKALDMLKELEAQGKLELVGWRQSGPHIIGREPLLDC